MDKKHVASLISWAGVFLWMAVIFIMSSLPGEDIPDFNIPNLDKAVHFFEFFILAILLLRAFLKSYYGVSPVKMVVLAAAIAFIYALSDEFHQYFVPGRNADILDFIVDILGSSIGIALYGKAAKWQR